MLDEYSIEQRSRQIVDARSKNYFSEVLGCYAAGHYRSAVVMLWSVVVCDLVFKLQHLVDLYGDDKAKAILQEIGDMQANNERSPAWETKLVKLVAEKTELLDIAELENIFYLQRQRHLAAHPVINADLQLHRPNRETTRANIRNALDDLLTKAPILSKKIVSDLVEDLEQASDMSMADNRLKTYLESKYFTRFNPQVEKTVFRALWKFIFLQTNEKSEKNRVINYTALNLLYGRNRTNFDVQIETEKEFFSTIAKEESPLVFLIHFLSRSPHIYNLLADHAKMAIEHVAERDSSARCLAWFLSTTLEKHASNLANWISGNGYPYLDPDTWQSLKGLSDSQEWERTVIHLANCYYLASKNYNDADQRFAEVIRPALEMYSLGDCIQLIDGVQENSQTWERARARRDHGQLRAKVLELDSTFDITKYPVFFRNLD